MIPLAGKKPSAQFSTWETKGRRGQQAETGIRSRFPVKHTCWPLQSLPFPPSFSFLASSYTGKLRPKEGPDSFDIPKAAASLRTVLPSLAFSLNTSRPTEPSGEERERCDLTSFLPPELECATFQSRTSCPQVAQLCRHWAARAKLCGAGTPPISRTETFPGFSRP